MYPFINLGPLHLGTFGLLLWLAAVVAGVVLHKNFIRNGVDADALSIVTLVTIMGVLGAKAWHELQDVPALMAEMKQVARPEGRTGWAAAVRMLDLAAPAAAIGYGVGRIGCLTSGDGDYGINTTLPWGVHMAKDALVPPTPADALVQPTPVYEFLFALVIGWLIWRLGRKMLPLGWLTGLYLVLSGVGRFLVEFVRVNPKLYWGMSNAQVAALGSVVVGAGVMVWAKVKHEEVLPAIPDEAVAG
jgi:phosphatidylglycerol:prolipoprotein diacylglycerol transferase